MLRDLYVMKIDAKQELDNINNDEEIKRFINSIIVPDGINIDYLLDGERYFLTGDKGAGKTALLIYTALKAEELFNAERSFIIFKEISQEEREDYKRIAHVTEYDQDDIKPFYDYEQVWKWLIHKNIADTIMHSSKTIFVQDEHLETYLKAINAVKTSSVNGKLPFIGKDGYIEANLGGFISGRINFEVKKNEKNLIKFSTHIKEIDRLFMNLSASESQLYIIVDELNLSMKNSAEFERDVTMIRDLIIIIENMNMISKNSHDNLRIISGVRNEVINSIQSKGKEINKAIESYGIPIDWTYYRENKLEHPLIKVLINYLRLSDVILKDFTKRSDREVYEKWIIDRMFGRPSDEIILSNTLYRPRHVVRMLNLAKLYCPYDYIITEDTIKKTRKEYSKACWNEAVEELSVIYNDEQIAAIKNLFAGSKSIVNKELLYEKAKKDWANNTKQTLLLETFDDLLRVLYTIGIIGNYKYDGSKAYYRWYCRGDETLLLDQEFQIHRIFWPVLSIVGERRNY